MPDAHSIEPPDEYGGLWCHEECLAASPHWWGERPDPTQIQEIRDKGLSLGEVPGDIEPIMDTIGGIALFHGERGDLDRVNPYACLCGELNYLQCPHFDEGIQDWVIRKREVPDARRL